MKNQANGIKPIVTMLTISIILGILLVGCGGPGYQKDKINQDSQGFPRDRMNQGAQGFPRDRMGGPGFRMNETAMKEMQEKAKTACQDKQEQAPCQMESPRGNMTGTCVKFNETISCRPEMRDGRQPPMGGMPQRMPPQ
ncbi:Uncharacterised protein [uncultured archaeon]|nr:Uncharacterised protein [uncultured archaeon]